MTMKRTERAQLLRDQKEAAEAYWRAITSGGYSAEYVVERMRELAARSLRLHIFEQGRRAGRRG